MGMTIRAKFSKGVIKPLEEIDITEGKEITVTSKEVPLKIKKDAFERAAGACEDKEGHFPISMIPSLVILPSGKIQS